ncbi:MAG: hypothetical protein HRT44_09645, partial [Bdellovibrionales bacterium]|nr:hypothetical protein [Bdellovibrionales bacterium]
MSFSLLSPFKKIILIMVFYYSDTFDIPLPPRHRFPGKKYSQLRNELLVKNILREDQLIQSPLAEKEEILLVHEEQYVNDFLTGSIDLKKMKR